MKQRPSIYWEKISAIDYAYVDDAGHPLGDSFYISARLSSRELNDNFFVADFGKMKKELKEFIDLKFDHVLWLNQDKHRATQGNGGFNVVTSAFEYSGPECAFFLYHKDPLQTLQKQIQSYLDQHYPSRQFEIHIGRTDTKSARIMRYTHGLKKHDGNCQRLLHGHRSILTQLDASVPSKVIEFIEMQLDGKHLVWKENITNENKDWIKISYSSSQGQYHLKIKPSLCHILPAESTIENITSYVGHLLKKQFPTLQGRLYLREGLDKGALIEL